jgi:aerobic carbon-monoxide dehydrogenase small subunit
MSERSDITLTINGHAHAIRVEPRRTLVDAIREDCGQTGTHIGCEHGVCGACTVLVDGEPVRSCVTKLSAVATNEIMTIEGLAKDGKLHPLQEAFLEVGAMQCGYCTCGMIMSGVGLLRKNPHPTREEIVEHMNGNICRCGTYPRIIAALATAAKSIKEASR